MLEQRPSKEYHDQKHCADGVEGRHGPQAEQADDLREGCLMLMEHDDGEDTAQKGGQGHGADSGAYRRGSIARECGRRTGR